MFKFSNLLSSKEESEALNFCMSENHTSTKKYVQLNFEA